MQPVKVDEPTVEETITILRGIQPKYQDYHHVKYTDEAITAAAELSNRYIQDRFLPDKAIDLLDEAGSKMNLTLNFVDPKDIDKRLIEAENLKAQATRDEDFEKLPISVIKLPNTRKCKTNHQRPRYAYHHRKTYRSHCGTKPIFLSVI